MARAVGDGNGLVSNMFGLINGLTHQKTIHRAQIEKRGFLNLLEAISGPVHVRQQGRIRARNHG